MHRFLRRLSLPQLGRSRTHLEKKLASLICSNHINDKTPSTLQGGQKCFYHASPMLQAFWNRTESVSDTNVEKTYDLREAFSPSIQDSARDIMTSSEDIVTSSEDIMNSSEETLGSIAEIDPSLVQDTTSNIVESASTFAELGLGGSLYPHYVVQDILNYLHTTVGLEWCPAIALAAILLRTLGLPGYIATRRFTVRSANHFPKSFELQQKIQRAQFQRNNIELHKARMEYMDFMKEKNINPLKALMYQLPNGLIFMSMFMGLRGMCSAHLPSLQTGGLLWFTNLTIPDPYMILPVLSCVSMSAIIYFGAADAELGPAAQVTWMRKIVLWLPIVSLPFLVFQPSAMFAFWMVSNVFSIILTILFRNKNVKRLFGVPEYVKHDKEVIKNMQNAMNPMAAYKKMKKEQEEAKRALEKFEKHREMLERFKEQQKKK